jgi:hydrogenase expression/formation protein HypE
MASHPLGQHAAAIGAVTSDLRGCVSMHTVLGGHRIVDMLVGDQLPRIC